MKTDIEKLDSVLNEYGRRKSLVEQSLSVADVSQAPRLVNSLTEITAEISRLLMVRAEMMVRIKRAKSILLLAVAMRRKRFRAF